MQSERERKERERERETRAKRKEPSLFTALLAYPPSKYRFSPSHVFARRHAPSNVKTLSAFAAVRRTIDSRRR